MGCRDWAGPQIVKLRFYHVDCDAFYCSCESVFDPRLADRALVVLSNNDGCVVARSAQAKLLGVKMGTPWFALRELAQTNRIVGRSSNYALYQDMSNRVMAILADMSVQQEVYSLDESFCLAPERDALQHAQAIRSRVLQWTGLSVCVGISSSKGRAKLATHVAKTRHEYKGVFDLDALSGREQDRLLAQIDVGEVWGIGRHLEPRLKALGIDTVLALRDADAGAMRQQFGVVMERIVLELRGTSCLQLQDCTPPRQQIISSRSFGQEVVRQSELREAVLSYLATAAQKLRAQQSVAAAVMVYIHTNPFRLDRPQYSRSYRLSLPQPTDDSLELARCACDALSRIFREGYRYKKAGVVLSELAPKAQHQRSLFENRSHDDRRDRLNTAMDQVNQRFGRGSIGLAAAGIAKPWAMKRGSLSPAYTTDWNSLPSVH